MDAVETPHGPAHVHLHEVGDSAGWLVLGHGAGGGIAAPDLQAATRAANELGVAVALVEQPYRVAGRRTAPAPPRLDVAWKVVLDRLRADAVAGLPLVTGGRSSGARVACRTAADTGARGVLCLAFPVHPPGRPEKSRLSELDAVGVPVLVIQGASDPFGMPPPAPGRTVVAVPGTHSLKGAGVEIGAAVRDWLGQLLDERA